jgi:hypothetical protein
MGGITKSDMRVMLDQFIGMIDFNLNISEEQFKMVKIELKRRIGISHGRVVLLKE